MEPANLPSAVEPSEWFVVFHRTAVSRLFSFLAFGEFKHVSAFGYCAGFKAWVVYDVAWSGCCIRLVAHNAQGIAALAAWTRGCDLVKIAKRETTLSVHSRLGLYCVSAIKHLLGQECVAARPDALYRHLLKNGGVLIAGLVTPGGSGRPVPAV